MTFVHVVFGEMVPKNLAFSAPDRAALLLAPPLVLVSRAMRPVIASLNWLANLVLRTFKVEPKDESTSTYTMDQVAGIIGAVTARRPLVDHSGTLAGAFEFTDKSVAEVEVGHDNVVTTSGYLHMKVVIELGPDELAVPVPHKRIRRLVADPRQTALEDVIEVLVGEVSDVA
jgi:CBS domain containing-hemolysin-like protein